jgi:hypothetical protein
MIHNVKKPSVQALTQSDDEDTERNPLKTAESTPELERIQKDMSVELAGRGYDSEAIEHELGLVGGATDPGMYDPVDLVTDFMTGGTTFLMRQTTKAGIKATAKGVAKEGAKDVALGGVAGTAMVGADFAGAGQVVETMSGVVGPTATQAILSGGRRGMIQFMKNIKKNNPKAHDEILKSANAAPDSDISKTIRGKLKPEKVEIPKKTEQNLKRILGFKALPLVQTTKDPTVGKRLQDMADFDPLPKHGININFNRIASEKDVKQTILKVSELFKKDINTARRNVVTNEEVSKLADQIGMTPEDLLRRRRGVAFNAEKALAARKILVASGERLKSLADAARGGSNLQQFEFRKQLALHYAIQSQVSGLTAEAGRALQSFRINAKATKQQLDEIDSLLKNIPGKASQKT